MKQTIMEAYSNISKDILQDSIKTIVTEDANEEFEQQLADDDYQRGIDPHFDDEDGSPEFGPDETDDENKYLDGAWYATISKKKGFRRALRYNEVLGTFENGRGVSVDESIAYIGKEIPFSFWPVESSNESMIIPGAKDTIDNQLSKDWEAEEEVEAEIDSRELPKGSEPVELKESKVLPTSSIMDVYNNISTEPVDKNS
jgi:hypothetical protein